MTEKDFGSKERMDQAVAVMNAGGNPASMRASRCPFGCPVHFDPKEPDKCKHLVGFTEDGRVVELRDRYFGRERTGVLTRTVEEGDRLIPVVVPGRRFPTTSKAVYRADGNAPIETDTTQPARDAHVLQERIRSLQADVDRITAQKERTEAAGGPKQLTAATV